MKWCNSMHIRLCKYLKLRCSERLKQGGVIWNVWHLAGVHTPRRTLSLTWGDARWQNAICTFSHLILFFSSSPSLSSFFLCHAKFLLISIQSVFPFDPLHVFLSVLLSGTLFLLPESLFRSLFYLTCRLSLSLSLSLCSRLVQCEQGLSMKIFNYTPRLPRTLPTSSVTPLGP